MATIAEARPDLVERLVNPEDKELSLKSPSKVLVWCDGTYFDKVRHPREEYWQNRSSFTDDRNSCPACGKSGYLSSIRYKTPDLVNMLVNKDDESVDYRSAKMLELVCTGTEDNPHTPSYYKQKAHSFTSGMNGCTFCGKNGLSRSIQHTRPDLLSRLVHPERDGKVSALTSEKVRVRCVGYGEFLHEAEEYDQSARNLSMGQSSCPRCKYLLKSVPMVTRHPELVVRLVNSEDKFVGRGSAKRVLVWCDGSVRDMPPHTRIEYSQKMVDFTKGLNGCFMCSNHSSHGYKKTIAVISSIIDHIENLSGAQKMALVLRRHGIKPGSPVGQAILKNDVPGLKEIMEGLGAEDKDESELADLVSGGSDEEDFLVPDADVEDSMSDEDLPSVSTKEGFAALEALSEISIGSDESAVRFLVDSAVHRLWQMLYAAGDVQAYIREVRERLDDCSNDYMCEFLGEFLRQYDEASALEVPKRWGFYEPNLMQKHMALLVGERKLVGNWSGTGAGKTASAVLSAMIGERNNVLVVCPNNTVKGWKETIEICDPTAEVLTKTFKPEWSDESGSKWLVLNFDMFSGREESALKMMQDVEFDMLVIDELHWVKERGGTQVSQRRETLRMVRSEMPEDSFVLGMSATPVVNDLSEGRSLIGLIDGRDPDFDTRPNLNNVQALHENMVRVGFRAIIPPKVGFDGEEFIDVDITHIKDELLVPGISHVTVDAIVAMEFAETIAELAREAKSRGKGVMVYTEYLTGIDEPLTQYLRGEGLRVAHFTGSHEKADIGSLVGNFDVLIGTQAIGTGVDGVQKWADTVVYATLPWTSAQFEQSRARVYRQGSTAETVRVVIPRGVVYLEDGKEWSWTDARWNRIKSKKDLASAAVDGEFPEHVVSSPKEATTAALAMLERLS